MSTEPKRPKKRAARRRRQLYTYYNRPVFIPEGHLIVGRIVGVHGLKGEVKVELHTDFPERFQPGAVMYLGEELTPVKLVSARPHKGRLLVGLEGVEGRPAAEELRGEWLYIPEEEAHELEEGVYWIHDLMGLAVQTEEGRPLGVIKDVLVTGANDVYVVKTQEDVNQGRDLLIPAIADVVQEVDLERGVMTVRLLPGMEEEAKPPKKPGKRRPRRGRGRQAQRSGEAEPPSKDSPE